MGIDGQKQKKYASSEPELKAVFCTKTCEMQRAAGWSKGNALNFGSVVQDLINSRKFGEALTYLEKALPLNPGHASVLEAMGICYEGLGRLEDAAHSYAEALPNHCNVFTTTRLAKVALSAELYEVAEAAFKVLARAVLKTDENHYATALSPCVSIDSWRTEHHAAAFETAPESEVKLVRPDGGLMQPYKANAERFAVIPNATAIAGWDFVIAPNGDVLRDSAYFSINGGGEYSFVPHVANKANSKVLRVAPKVTKAIDADALFLSAPERYHFGHWVFDFLPRLQGLREKEKSRLKIFTVEGLPQHLRDTLALFGVYGDDLIEGKIGEAYRFKSLVVYCGHEEGKENPSMIKFIHNALSLTQTRKADPDQSRRFFLQRTGARGRNIINVDEFNNLLAEFEFETVRRPEIAIRDQNTKFGSAEIIISAFGTDMVTAYQLKPGTDVIVLCHDRAEVQSSCDLENQLVSAHKHLDQICATIGIHLHKFYCEPIQINRGYSHLQDMIINCDALRRLIKEVVDKRIAAKTSAHSISE